MLRRSSKYTVFHVLLFVQRCDANGVAWGAQDCTKRRSSLSAAADQQCKQYRPARARVWRAGRMRVCALFHGRHNVCKLMGVDCNPTAIAHAGPA